MNEEQQMFDEHVTAMFQRVSDQSYKIVVFMDSGAEYVIKRYQTFQEAEDALDSLIYNIENSHNQQFLYIRDEGKRFIAVATNHIVSFEVKK